MRFEGRCTAELLCRVLDADSARAFRGSLKPFFAPREDEVHHEHLLIIRELIRRWFDEEMRTGCLVTNPHHVRAYLQMDLAKEEQEIFVVVFVDNANRVIAHERMFYGSIGESYVSIRDVVKAIVRHNATGVILAHNHPSGANILSLADVALTKQIKEALALIDVRLLDHIVIAGTSIHSCAANGQL